MLTIGLTGQPSSGKDTAADFFVSKGFVHISSSDLIREEMRKQGIPTDRSHIHDFVIEERKKYGLGYLAERAADKIAVAGTMDDAGAISGAPGTIVSGLRNTAEIDILRKRFGNGFIMLATEASLEARYERARARGRVGDDISFERFKQEEEAERKSSDGAHEVDAVIATADEVIRNDGTKEQFMQALERVLESTAARLQAGK